jgi:hypothetical protein
MRRALLSSDDWILLYMLLSVTLFESVQPNSEYKKMPSVKPRINVVMEQDTFDVISEYCELAGVSRSKFLSESAAKASHALAKLLPLMRIAKQMDDHTKEAADSVLSDAKFGLLDLERSIGVDIGYLLEIAGASDCAAVSLPAAASTAEASELPPSINKGVRVSEKEPKSKDKSNIYSIFKNEE